MRCGPSFRFFQFRLYFLLCSLFQISIIRHFYETKHSRSILNSTKYIFMYLLLVMERLEYRVFIVDPIQSSKELPSLCSLGPPHPGKNPEKPVGKTWEFRERGGGLKLHKDGKKYLKINVFTISISS